MASRILTIDFFADLRADHNNVGVSPVSFMGLRIMWDNCKSLSFCDMKFVKASLLHQI